MTPNDRDDGGKRIKSVQRAFDVIRAIQGAGNVRIADLADGLEMPRSTAHVYLKTLESEGFVTHDDAGYRLSLRFLQTGVIARHQYTIYSTAKSEVDKLAEATGEVANLGIEENGLRVILYQSEGSDAVYDNALTGEHSKMHLTALGKVLLAYQPSKYIDDIVDRHGLPAATENSITEFEELLQEFRTIELQGYALEDEERRKGIRSIATPIIANGALLGALSLSGPKERLREQRIAEELLPELRNTTNIIEVKHTYD